MAKSSEGLDDGSHLVRRMMMDIIYVRTDLAAKIKADKEKSADKTDGTITTIMGLNRAIRSGNNSSEIIYDTRGLFVFT